MPFDRSVDLIYTPMAARRLKIFTGSVFLVIILLTFIARNIDVKKPSNIPAKRRFYIQRNPTFDYLNSVEQLTESKELWNTSKHRNTNRFNLTRYGANLEFDSSLCPKNSLMRSSKWKYSSPRTLKCPQVFIVGAKKGGTTSLYQYLSKHPDFEGIRLNESKWIGETFYFAQKYSSLRLSQYLKLFPKHKMTGDASVDNLLYCKSPERILKTCGSKTKIIVLLRHPIKRYISNFMMRTERPAYTTYNKYTSISDTIENELHNFNALLEKKGIDIPRKKSDWLKYRCLLSCCTSMIYEGMYYVFVMNWLCNFPKESILFINSEEMFSYPIKVYEEVLMFLGLKPLYEDKIKEITSTVYNQGPKPIEPQHQLSQSDYEKLNNIYRPFNEGVLALLKWEYNVDWS